MNDQTLKSKLLNTYLHQQQNNINDGKKTSQSVVSKTDLQENAVILYNDIPENISLEEFKNYVKKWFEFDNFIKKAKDIIKEKKASRDKLSELISKFMCKYDIEDLNTKEGRIRCKTTVVKAPINQKIVKDKITDYFRENESQKNEILHKIYDDREKVEKVSLRRLKIT
jgi:hypothetical protein